MRAAALFFALFIFGVAPENSTLPGPYVQSFSPAAVRSADAHLAAALGACGSVEGYLPPSSFLLYLHAPSRSCFQSLASVPGAASRAAPLPARARLDPRLAAADAPPLRGLSLLLARSAPAGRSLPPRVTAAVAAHCPHCAPPALTDGGRGAHVSALGGCPGCGLDAPSSSACGCALPASLAGALAELPEVLWVTRAGGVVGMTFAGTAALAAGDFYNLGAVPTLRPYFPRGGAASYFQWMPGDGEAGPCLGGCDLSRQLPWAAVVKAYGPFNSSTTPVRQGGGAASRQFLRAPPGAAAVAGRALQPNCDVGGGCGGLACGFGYGACDGFAAPLADVGLSGEGQVVLIVTDGLATGSPFFYDPVVGAPVVGTAPVPPVLPTRHRKVAYYWAYADGSDSNAVGHGTHTAASVAGDALALPGLSNEERATFSAGQGVASGARVVIADFACGDAAGCPLSSGSPPRAAPLCGYGQWCPPLSVSDMFESARVAGAGVAANPWGSGTSDGAYTATSAALDAYVFNNASDMLLVFASGSNQSQLFTESWYCGAGCRVSEQAAAKNVLAVGAIYDGLLAHAKNTGAPAGAPAPAPFQPQDGRACRSIVARMAKEPRGGDVLVPAPCPAPGDAGPCFACPAAPTPVKCFFLAAFGMRVFSPAGYTSASNYGGNGTAELALCCGCSLSDVVDGCLAAGMPCDGTAPGGRDQLWSLLMWIQSTYNSRMSSESASVSGFDGNARGPTADGRIKVRVTLCPLHSPLCSPPPPAPPFPFFALTPKPHKPPPPRAHHRTTSAARCCGARLRDLQRRGGVLLWWVRFSL